MTCDPKLACLYFALVAVVLILILMQEWCVGYYKPVGKCASGNAVSAENMLPTVNRRRMLPTVNRRASENMLPTVNRRRMLPTVNSKGRRANCPNKALCPEKFAVKDPLLDSTTGSLLDIAHGSRNRMPVPDKRCPNGLLC